jgi:hypothetical protein
MILVLGNSSDVNYPRQNKRSREIEQTVCCLRPSKFAVKKMGSSGQTDSK